MTGPEWLSPLPLEEGRARAMALFAETFATEPRGVWSAPGRVNLIGEHTDYNGGTCLPLALPHRTFVALRPRPDALVRAVSAQRPGEVWRTSLGEVTPGRVDGWGAYVAGVAWAPTRGISKVEVQVDDGPWRPCELGPVSGDETWVQWIYRWRAEPGDHVVSVRATDGDGETQTSDVARPDPDGATGWHSRRWTVTG